MAASKRMLRYAESAIGLMELPLAWAYEAIAAARASRRKKGWAARRLRLRAAIKTWLIRGIAARVPANLGALFRLALAERAAAAGKSRLARDRYDHAIAMALEHGQASVAALAWERAGEHLMEAGHSRVGRFYLAEARQAFRRWGAGAKVEDLDARHPGLVVEPSRASRATTRQTLHSTQTSSTTYEKTTLDLESVTRALQALSSEMVLETLLERLMGVVMQCAGAERGVLLLPRQQGWWVEASASMAAGETLQVARMQDVRLEDSRDLAQRVVHYVVRTQEPVILDDARAAGLFSRDEYIRRAQPSSLLCLPLLRKGTVTGALYLENNQTTGAFTDERVEVLRIMGGQAAISIENAQLYEQQVEQNRAASRFVPHEFLRFLGKQTLAECRLGDHVSQFMTVLFADIRDFTTMSEQMTVEDNFQFVNAFLGRIGPVIERHRGFIMTYIGDAIMALFPGADDGVRAGLAMLEKLQQFNAERGVAGHEPIRIGIGLNSGQLMMGTIGEPNRIEGTVISDAVNVASRVEGLTKEYGRPMLITQQTVDRLAAPDAYAIEAVDRVAVRGKSEPVTVYAIAAASA